MVCASLLNRQAHSTQQTTGMDCDTVKAGRLSTTFTDDDLDSQSLPTMGVVTDLWCAVDRCLVSGECVVAWVQTTGTTILAQVTLDGDQQSQSVSFTTGVPTGGSNILLGVQTIGLAEPLSLTVGAQGIDCPE